MIQGKTFEEKYQSFFKYFNQPRTISEIIEFIDKNKIPSDAPFRKIHLNMIDTKNLNILFYIVTTSSSDNDCLQKLRLLIEKYDVNYNIFDFNYHRKIPFYTCIKGYLESTKYLIDKMNFTIDYVDEREQSLFFSAIRSYNLELVEYLDKKFPRWIYFPDNKNYTCIFNIFKKNMNEEDNKKFKNVLKYILKKGFDIDEKSLDNISFRQKCEYFQKQDMLQEVIKEIEIENNEKYNKEMNDVDNEINMNDNFYEETQINNIEIVQNKNIIFNNNIINTKLIVNNNDKNYQENKCKIINENKSNHLQIEEKRRERRNKEKKDEKEKSIEKREKEELSKKNNIDKKKIEKEFHKEKNDKNSKINSVNNNNIIPPNDSLNKVKNNNVSNLNENKNNNNNKEEINFSNINQFQNNIENNISFQKLDKKIGSSLNKEESEISNNNEKNKMNDNHYTSDDESKEIDKSRYEISLNSKEEFDFTDKSQNEKDSKNNNQEKFKCIYFDQKSNLVLDPERVKELISSNPILSKFLNKVRK